jgi:hypothetical protein
MQNYVNFIKEAKLYILIIIVIYIFKYNDIE